jgi:hypothetical protein
MASSPQRCGNLHRFSDEHRAAGSAVHQGRGALVAIDLPTTFFFAQGRIASTGPGSAPWSILCDNAAFDPKGGICGRLASALAMDKVGFCALHLASA